ncbi:hypothetical protein PMIN06_007368 [Paraphaeosphaeria minitans]
MAWAAKRETTREEDTAYCLFGLFQVNAPLLYGEGGKRAFERLQEDTIKKTNDLTILAWMNPGPRISGITSILAPHPRYFSRSQYIRPQNRIGGNPEFTVTNKGLKIKTLVYRSNGKIFMPLNCLIRADTNILLSISLMSGKDGVFFRNADFGGLPVPLDSQGIEELIYIAMDTKRALLERTVTLAVPLEDGSFEFIQVEAWVDHNYPCNLFSRSLAQKYSIKYDSMKRRSYEGTLEGPAYSRARFTARYSDTKAQHLKEEDFDNHCHRAIFDVLDVDLRYGISIIFGRPAMHGCLTTMEGHFAPAF